MAKQFRGRRQSFRIKRFPVFLDIFFLAIVSCSGSHAVPFSFFQRHCVKSETVHNLNLTTGKITRGGSSELSNKSQSLHTLLEKAEQHAAKEQVLQAARCLRQAQASHANIELNGDLKRILHIAGCVNSTTSELATTPDEEMWAKISSVHKGKRPIIVHYQMDDKRRTTFRIEILIEKALLVPLLAVLIETELYNTWVPRWKFPAVGIQFVTKLAQTGRTKQILHVGIEAPWPFHKREIILSSTGMEDIDETGLIAIHLDTIQPDNNHSHHGIIPPPEPGVERIDFEGCFVFQKCPDNHPILENCIAASIQQEDFCNGECLILVGFLLFVDAKIPSLFPMWIVNFVLRTATAKTIKILLSLAEDVRFGRRQRQDHVLAMARKRKELYDWVDERTTILEHIDAESKQCNGNW